MLLDAGANADAQADWLVQFAQLGAVFARDRFGIETPRVGLLSIGEEPGKGDQLRKDTYALLDEGSWAAPAGATFRRQCPGQSSAFVGPLISVGLADIGLVEIVG